jgi:translation initiation factor IF-3
LSRPFPSRHSSSDSFLRVNGKIRAREVRVVFGEKQLGVISLNEALTLARQQGVDLVEIAPNATPPVCRLVEIGKFRYEKAKKEKESKKHQHASTVKEVQLSPRIDPHDLSIKIEHAVGFLCEDMKVKVALKFRGREMQHTEIGFQVIRKFIEAVAPFGHPDFEPKLIGRGINAMISPLPRSKRAKNPYAVEGEGVRPPASAAVANNRPAAPPPPGAAARAAHPPVAEKSAPDGFANSPFDKLEVK